MFPLSCLTSSPASSSFLRHQATVQAKVEPKPMQSSLELAATSASQRLASAMSGYSPVLNGSNYHVLDQHGGRKPEVSSYLGMNHQATAGGGDSPGYSGLNPHSGGGGGGGESSGYLGINHQTGGGAEGSGYLGLSPGSAGSSGSLMHNYQGGGGAFDVQKQSSGSLGSPSYLPQQQNLGSSGYLAQQQSMGSSGYLAQQHNLGSSGYLTQQPNQGSSGYLTQQPNLGSSGYLAQQNMGSSGYLAQQPNLGSSGYLAQQPTVGGSVYLAQQNMGSSGYLAQQNMGSSGYLAQQNVGSGVLMAQNYQSSAGMGSSGYLAQNNYGSGSLGSAAFLAQSGGIMDPKMAYAWQHLKADFMQPRINHIHKAVNPLLEASRMQREQYGDIPMADMVPESGLELLHGRLQRDPRGSRSDPQMDHLRREREYKLGRQTSSEQEIQARLNELPMIVRQERHRRRVERQSSSEQEGNGGKPRLQRQDSSDLEGSVKDGSVKDGSDNRSG